LSETTVRSWISRAGQHSQSLNNHVLRALKLTHVQLDELRLKLRGAAEAAWLWVACDARTKLIPDGLALYFFALTAHFGEWVHTVGERRRVWTVKLQLLYAQVIKRYRRRHVAEVRHQVQLGTPEAYRQALWAAGFSGRIQTAFVERLNLTIRRSIAGLARRSWSTAHSLSELTLHFEWWRAYYHFVRPHASLRQLTGRTRPRYRSRTPAQAAALTDHRWTVRELLACPAPPLKVG
jgi:IS1 family transposase